MEKRIYRFSQSHCDWTGSASDAKKLLGGKGAGLVKMCQAEMPVPPGFTITTAVCNEYLAAQKDGTLSQEWFDGLMAEVYEHMEWLEGQFGYRPLVSVRSGAPISMPGMMDTILNVGLCNDNFKEWGERIGARAVHDSDRRLTQMLGATAYGVPMEVFEFQLAKVKKAHGMVEDTDLGVLELSEVIGAYRKAFEENKGFKFPFDDWKEQLRAAVAAVFTSWTNERAVEYRKINKIDAAMGTAVNIQAMVFGNMGDDSGSGVGFTRDPSTGERKFFGEYLKNAQGEDVVAGIRTPETLKLDQFPIIGQKMPPAWQKELSDLCIKLEAMYEDMVDLEFTVQKEKLWLLQSRTGKRSARAAFKIAVDLVEEGMIDKGTAISRLTVDQFKIVRRPTIDPKFDTAPNKVGLPACPGVVTGKPVYSAADAINCKEPCILVTHETTPDDIAGMNAAVGILTQTGGATSHAAVVARAMDKACVVGCTELDIAAMKNLGIEKVTIDGSTGKVWLQIEVPVIDSSDAPELRVVMDWCLGVMGACETAVVDLGMDRPHTIMAATWWGNVDVLNAILDGVAELPSRGHVTLDMRGPHDLIPDEDKELGACFGDDQSGDEFWKVMMDTLIDRQGELKGLALANMPMQDTITQKVMFDQCGYKQAGAGFQHVPVAVPADFAAFSVLGR